MENIDALQSTINEARCELIVGPTARTWDVKPGIFLRNRYQTQKTKIISSVHYIVQPLAKLISCDTRS